MAIQKVVERLQDKLTTLQVDFQHIVTGLLLLPVLYVLINEFIRSGARIANLKGPRGLPLIGNLHQIRVNAAEQYRQWANKYGGVYQIQLGNIPVVVVNTAEAAKVIFGNNALSSRPEFYTFHKVRVFGFVIWPKLM
jgi:3-hydroxyphenylacetate 6-hydroxylase